MSPLRVEAYNADFSRWVQVGSDLGPGDRPGTISSNLTDGTREIYQFFCAGDDSYSVVQKLQFGLDAEIGRLRILDAQNVADAVRVATLRRGGQSYRLTVKTDRSSQRRIIRFTHR